MNTFFNTILYYLYMFNNIILMSIITFSQQKSNNCDEVLVTIKAERIWFAL